MQQLFWLQNIWQEQARELAIIVAVLQMGYEPLRYIKDYLLWMNI